MARVFRWLTALADPTGPAETLPVKSLQPKSLTAMMSLADAHGVLPAVMANLRLSQEQLGARRVVATDDGQAEATLEEAMGRARDVLLRRSGACLLIRRQTAQVREAMKAADIPAVVIKGVEFADRLYPQPELRTFTDVDLLVAPDAVDTADAAIRSAGYQPRAVSMKYADGYGERSYVLPSGGAVVEVHWNLVNSPSLRRGVSVELGDLRRGQDGVLCPASLLLIAAVHAAASHGFDRLQPLCDVCQAARGVAGEIDVDWLTETLHRTGSALAISAALGLAGKMLNEPRCDELRRRLGLSDSPTVRLLLTPGVILRAHAYRDSFRRCLFRAMLKGRR